MTGQQAVRWALEQPIKATEGKFALVVLAEHSKDGYCFPGQETIAEETGQCVRTVASHLAKLEELGYIAKEKRHRENGSRKSDGYILNFDRKAVADDKTNQDAKFVDQYAEFADRTPNQDAKFVDQYATYVSQHANLAPLEPEVLTRSINTKLSLASEIQIFQEIHPTASIKCIEELEKAGGSAKWALDTWGNEGLKGLLNEAHKINSGNRLGFIWADFILSRGRCSENIKPLHVAAETEVSAADWFLGKN